MIKILMTNKEEIEISGDKKDYAVCVQALQRNQWPQYTDEAKNEHAINPNCVSHIMWSPDTTSCIETDETAEQLEYTSLYNLVKKTCNSCYYCGKGTTYECLTCKGFDKWRSR